MDDSRVPWWLVLLLGVCAAGLAVWQSARPQRQLRWGAGVLTLFYLGLLAAAVAGLPGKSAIEFSWQNPQTALNALCAVSLVLALLVTGRPSDRGQLVWFGLLSLANAGICFVTGLPSVAMALVVCVALPVGILLACQARLNRLDLKELWPGFPAKHADEPKLIGWMAGVAGFLLAISLIATTRYAIQAETSRATSTRRHSALPSRTRIRELLEVNSSSPAGRTGGWRELLIRRADVFALLAILAPVAAASRLAKPDSSTSSPSEP